MPMLHHCVENPGGLDKLQGDVLSMEIVPDMLKHLEKLGIKPFRKSSYAAACTEGWAPGPTNDYQKAIWNQVHEIPAKPIKIEYNEKRDKGK